MKQFIAFVRKRISPYPARPAYHADTDRHADCTDYPFRLCHLDWSPDEIERLFRRNLIELAVVFPSDLHRLRFDSEEIQILADATDPSLAVTRSTYAQTILRQALQTIRQATTTPAYSHPDKQPVMVYNKLLYNPQMKSAYNFVPGVMGLILMLICAMMTSISIVREKETGTMEVLLVSHVNPLVHHSVEGSSLFRVVPTEPDDHPAAFRLCARRTDSRKPACPVSVGHGTDDTHHHPVGHYLPDRKYAGHSAGPLLPYSRTLVRRNRPPADD